MPVRPSVVCHRPAAPPACVKTSPSGLTNKYCRVRLQHNPRTPLPLHSVTPTSLLFPGLACVSSLPASHPCFQRSPRRHPPGSRRRGLASRPLYSQGRKPPASRGPPGARSPDASSSCPSSATAPAYPAQHHSGSRKAPPACSAGRRDSPARAGPPLCPTTETPAYPRRPADRPLPAAAPPLRCR